MVTWKRTSIVLRWESILYQKFYGHKKTIRARTYSLSLYILAMRKTPSLEIKIDAIRELESSSLLFNWIHSLG